MEIREAREEDVPAIVALLADDMLGQGREYLDDIPRYLTAFRAMAAEPGNRQYVALVDGDIVGCFQLTLISGLSNGGRYRAQLEGVRIASALRGQGLGRKMITEAIAIARAAGAAMVQLTSNRRRDQAIRFYESLGFEHSHAGMKRALDLGKVD